MSLLVASENKSFIQNDRKCLDCNKRTILFDHFMFCNLKFSFGPFFVVTYLVFCFFYFYITIGPYFLENSLTIYYTGIVLVICLLTFLLDCIFSDPGYTDLKGEDGNIYKENISSNEDGVEIDGDQNLSKLEKLEKFYTTRYCVTCKRDKLPKSSHCKYCDICVKEFDHHCFFVSNCIGERNIKSFWLATVIGSILCLFAFLITSIQIYALIINNQNLLSSFKNEITEQSSIFYAIIGFGGLMILCGGNFFFKCVGITIIGVKMIFFTSGLLGPNVVYYENPSYGIFFIIIITPIFSIIFENAGENLRNSFYGITFKENILIKSSGSRKKNDEVFEISFHQGFNNIKNFFNRSRSRSEILNNNWLFKTKN